MPSEFPDYTGLGEACRHTMFLPRFHLSATATLPAGRPASSHLTGYTALFSWQGGAETGLPS